MFVKNIRVEIMRYVCNLEHLCAYIPSVDILLIVLYRPPTYGQSMFEKSLATLMKKVNARFKCGIMIVGDFNDNLRISCVVEDLMGSQGFIQHVSEATTEANTIIDHVYTRNIENVAVTVLPTYFSYHEGVRIQLFK